MGNVPVVIQGKVETPVGFIELRSQDWLNWLSQHSSFRFEPQSEYPGFTARVEKSGYWYGYRKVSGKLHKRYIGKAEELTPERLEEIAALLEQPPQPRPKVTQNVPVTPKDNCVTQYATTEDLAQLRSELAQLREELALVKPKAR
jgi:hypothetical protein